MSKRFIRSLSQATRSSFYIAHQFWVAIISRPLSLEQCSSKSAVFDQWTLIAFGISWMADASAVKDQIDVQRVVFFRWDQFFDHLVSRFVTDFFRQQSHAAQDSENMSVHRKNRAFATEQQNAGGSFRPNAFQRKQEMARFVN